MTTTATTTAIVSAEVWVPTQSQHWELVEGSYATGLDFAPPSSIRTGSHGILAAVVREQNAVVCGDLDEEHSIRGSTPGGINGLIALPCFVDGHVASVLLLGIHCAEDGKAALEVWAGRTNTYELSLRDGLHPGLGTFASISKYVHMPHGSGLPGRAWSSGLPQLMRNIGSSRRFLRSSGASTQGLGTGLAIPLINGHTLHGVACLLSASESPLARAYEIWTPCARNGASRMCCAVAHHGDCHHLAAESQRLEIQPGQGLVGTAWSARRPLVWNNLIDNGFIRAEAATSDGLRSAIAFPVFHEQDVCAVAVILC